MELINICKSAPLKVNCFPECAVFTTPVTPGTEINVRKVTAGMKMLVRGGFLSADGAGRRLDEDLPENSR